MKAKIGVKKKFKTTNDKKSIIISALRSIFFLFEIYIDDKKLKHRNIIKNWLLKIEDSNTWKFKFLNITIVASLWNNKGAVITEDPFKKNKISDIKNFLLKGNTVSSFPKWKAATIRNNNKTVFGNISHKIIIEREIIR